MAHAADMISPETASAEAGGRPLGLGEVLAGLATGRTDSRAYLLVLRFALVNLFALALLCAATLQGWVGQLMANDTTHLVLLIVAVFLAGLALATRRVFQISWELNQLRAVIPNPSSRTAIYLRETTGREAASRALLASALKVKMASKIGSIRQVANGLVLLGLIGTVVGFIIALSGVEPEIAADVSAIGPMVSTLIEGMSIALHTTLVGAILNIWLMINARLVEGGTVKLITGIVERGEMHA